MKKYPPKRWHPIWETQKVSFIKFRKEKEVWVNFFLFGGTEFELGLVFAKQVVCHGSLTNFLPGLVLNSDPPDLCLPSSWNYSYAPLYQNYKN
jgi:hypothetical protein